MKIKCKQVLTTNDEFSLHGELKLEHNTRFILSDREFKKSSSQLKNWNTMTEVNPTADL